MIRILCALMLCGLLGLVGLMGCGGSPTGTALGQTGSTTVRILWPELVKPPMRFIPRATESVVITITDNNGYMETLLIVRPQDNTPSEATFPSVPVGSIAITVVAYPNADGTGTPLAEATAVTTIFFNQVTTVQIDLQSTIDRIGVTPMPGPIAQGGTATLVATAYNISNDVVTVLPDGFFWQSSDSNIASVGQLTGVLTANSPGIVTITATERETGLTASIQVEVRTNTGTLIIVIGNPAIAVHMAPNTATLTPNATQQFSATVDGVPNQAVLWSIQEGPSGGTITNTGLYTAPPTAGTYHIIATAMADLSKTDVATVTVSSGGTGNPGSVLTTLLFPVVTAVCANPATNRVYITHNVSPSDPSLNSVTVIDSASDTVVATIPVNTKGPAELDVNPTTNRVYVAGLNGDEVVVIDGGTDTVMTKIPVASVWGPSIVAVNPVTNRVYVGDYGGAVFVIDGSTNAVVSTITIPLGATGIAVNPLTNRVYVAIYNDSLTVIDGATNTVIANPFLVYNIEDVGMNPNNNLAYVTGAWDGYLHVIDCATNTQTSVIHMPSKPMHITIDPVNQFAYATGFESNTLMAVDLSNNTVLAPIPVGVYPRDVAINGTNRKVYVCNTTSHTVSVVQGF